MNKIICNLVAWGVATKKGALHWLGNTQRALYNLKKKLNKRVKSMICIGGEEGSGHFGPTLWLFSA